VEYIWKNRPGLSGDVVMNVNVTMPPPAPAKVTTEKSNLNIERARTDQPVVVKALIMKS
jgi:hypothetical protein